MTKVELLRKDGAGLKGTFTNANHHAQKVLPLVKKLAPFGELLGFALWKQGHNVHEFVTSDGRKFTVRPYTIDSSYHGLRLSVRMSRTVEFPLFDLNSEDDIPLLVNIMTGLARPIVGDAGRLTCTSL